MVAAGTDPQTLIDAAQRYAQAVVGQRHIKEPANWLHDERWTDEPRGNALLINDTDEAVQRFADLQAVVTDRQKRWGGT